MATEQDPGPARRWQATGEPVGWLLLCAESVPEPWRDRARPAFIVPLLPAEASSVLAGASAVPALDRDELALARLVASGRSTRAIAGDLGVSTRTVERRVARLRDRFGAGSTAELAVLLAQHGLSR